MVKLLTIQCQDESKEVDRILNRFKEINACPQCQRYILLRALRETLKDVPEMKVFVSILHDLEQALVNLA